MPEPILSLENLSVAYGGIRAVHDVSLHLMRGEWVTLVGANGAGKSSTLAAIAGLIVPQAGHVRVAGHDLRPGHAHELPRRGVSLVPEGRGIFTRMTVRENLLMGGYARPRATHTLLADLESTLELFGRLRERLDQLAGTLSGGEQQMLAMARALMNHPEILLLDEPSMGLAPVMVERIFEVISTISRQGTTILLVEQNARLALQHASRAYVMESGAITLEGPSGALLEDERVRQAYLGD